MNKEGLETKIKFVLFVSLNYEYKKSLIWQQKLDETTFLDRPLIFQTDLVYLWYFKMIW